MSDQNTDNPESQSSHKDEFLASNAEFFTIAFSDLNEPFQNSGSMKIVCEETKNTVAVGVKVTEDDDGEVEVDCVLLKPHQRSIRDCLNTLFTEN